VPAAKSGEFLCLSGIVEKFSAMLGPLIFAAAVATFGRSQPAMLSLLAFLSLAAGSSAASISKTGGGLPRRVISGR
jgi:MFS-type transporter involved in bile tolerance (Atg22 family)